MERTASLSTAIDAELREALTRYCKRRGLKIRHVVEQGLLEQLEDEIDRQAWLERRDEPRVALEAVLSARRGS